jgi:thioredoxin reductase (NADPH)
MDEQFDCIIIGAGPGGLQAAIYLGRYNRNVLLLDKGGGRTRHARHVENYLGHRLITGGEIIDIGIEQARSFNVDVRREAVEKVLKNELFEVQTGKSKYLSGFVIASTGVRDNLPQIEGLHKFLGVSFFTCIDCDGYRTTGKKLLIVGNSIHTVRLAFAMKEMYTEDITLILTSYRPPEDHIEELGDSDITLLHGEPKKLLGEKRLGALELEDGRLLECEAVMSDFGIRLNDKFLTGLKLERDSRGKYLVNRRYESTLKGLYIVGPLNTGPSQIVVAAGQGAVVAMDIKKRLLEM